MASPNIANYDFSATYDISGSGVLKIQDASAFIGSGASLVQGENYACTAPNGSVFHTNANWGSRADIPPPIADQILTFSLPQFNGEVLWGLYTIVGTIKDQDGTLYTKTKTQLICKPSGCCNDSGNNSCAQLDVSFDCIGSTTFVQDLTKFVYQNIVGVPAYSIQVNYPLNSPSAKTYNVGSFSDNPVYNGLYTFVVNDTATYDFGNNQFVVVGYIKTVTKNSFCSVSICDMYCALADYLIKYEGAQSTTQAQTFEKNLIKLNYLVNEVMLGLKCGQDVGDLVAQIESITGKSCACECGQQVPVSGNPATNTFIFESGGGDVAVTVTTVGNTTTVVIKDITYVLSPAMGQTGVTITSSQAGQTKTCFLAIYGDQLPIANSTVITGINSPMSDNTNLSYSAGAPVSSLIAGISNDFLVLRNYLQGLPLVWANAFAYAAGWSSAGSYPNKYATDKFGNLYLKGAMQSVGAVTVNNTGLLIATLPVNFRPAQTVVLKAWMQDTVTVYNDIFITILTNGQVVLDCPFTTHTTTGQLTVSFDGIVISTIS